MTGQVAFPALAHSLSQLQNTKKKLGLVESITEIETDSNKMKQLIVLLIAVVLLTGCAQPSIPSAEPVEPPPELYDKTWISPGKVMVGNFYPGARAEWPLTIHNGNAEPAQFEVKYSQPGSVEEGYIKAPSIVQDWVIIADPAPLLEAFETREVLIALEMPEDAEAPPKWEFWIAVKDVTQTGMVQTELATRWLVSMRD